MFKSEPLPGAVERDWTNEVLIVRVENSIGDVFEFSVPPRPVAVVGGQKTDSFQGKTVLDMHFPIL